ncbi:MAG: histone deacetylase family protein [Rhodobacteraceae bacterium]|nr:histone deacetylase family protein [Paracoccaceae bacterium]
MDIVHSPLHRGHTGHLELVAGAFLPAFEKPERADFVLEALRRAGLGPVRVPRAHDLKIAARVHDPAYLAFLARAHDMWLERGNSGPALPFIWPRPGLRADVPPRDIEGLLGHYSFDGGAPFVAGTWAAVRAAQDCALDAAAIVAGGARAAFSLARPPGHHAGPAFAGGYCYINNAAVAAEALLQAGAGRVAILDVDYHHGNGTQAIFEARADVLTVSIHADPRDEFPYFLGHADERGTGAGEGANLNLPLPLGTEWPAWADALATARGAIAAFGAEVMVVSLGVDTYEGDPISRFRLRTEDFARMGAGIAALGLGCVFVMEGGYAVVEIGDNVLGVLAGFEAG